MSQEYYTTLITVSDLGSRLNDADVIVVDCRSDLKDPEKGRRDYRAGHVPGAVFASLDDDLAAPVSETSGRHPLPSPDDFILTLRRLGVHKGSQVVAYDDASGGLAARLWWMLRWLGHTRVAVLDGGYAAWCAADLAISQADGAPVAGDFAGRADNDQVISTDALANALSAGEPFALVDARDSRRFRGEIEPIDPVAGHVPGAINMPFNTNLADDGRWRSAADVQAAWQSLEAFDPAAPWSVMCGSGVTACHLALAAELAGLPAPRLYVGSWSEWIRDPGRPVAGVSDD